VIVTYWGVRGSLPTPGPATVRYGGNSACVSVEVDGVVLVFDAGTGIRALGKALAGSRKEIFILLSHLHLDHVMGLPFFAPLHDPRARVRVLACRPGVSETSLLDLFDGVWFPRTEGLVSACRPGSGQGIGVLRELGLELATVALNHPGGAIGYRVTHRGCTLAHLTDNELYPPAGEQTTGFEELVEFCRGADLLSHDAQYRCDEWSRFRGRGHSAVNHVCELARRSAVKRLVLFHHDPSHDDEAMDAIEAEARVSLAGSGIRCSAAREGLTVELR
jgi:phosphoribosyl 1,2-cyclic phosphodiesterase